MATHSSVLVWRIPWTEEPGEATGHRVSKSRTRLKRLSPHAQRWAQEWLGGAAGGLPCPPLRRC